MTTPLSLYQADLLKPNFFADDAQLQAITMLQRLHDDLSNTKTQFVRKSSLLQRLFGNNEKENTVYIRWGVWTRVL